MYKNGSVTITPVQLAKWDSVIAVAVDLSFKVVYDGTIMSAADDIAYYVDLQSITQLTEEEFYNLDNGGGNSMIEFTINGTPYQAEEGMTWGEFVESSYNDGNVIYEAQYNSISYNGIPIFNNGKSVKPDTVIISGKDYISEEVG